MNIKLSKILDQLDDLERTKEIIDRLVSYKNYLSGIPYEKLKDKQKIWLLAFEASELKLSTSSKDSIAENIVLLRDAIIDIEK